MASDEALVLGAAAPAAPIPLTEQPVTLRTRRGQALLATFTGAHFSHHVSNSLLNPLLPYIRDSFALTYPQAGFLVSAFSLSLGLSNAPVGALADRVGSRPVIVVGLVLTGLVSAALAFSGSYWQLLALLVVMGLIAGSYHAPASALLARAFPVQARGAAMGLHITGGHLSYFITPLVAAILVSATGTWRTPYLWLAFAPIVLGALVWRMAPRRHERPSGGAGRLAAFREIRTVLAEVGPLVSVSILFQMVYAALLAFTALYLVDARGLAPEWAAILFGVPQLVGVLGAPLGGSLSDRIGRRRVILLGMALLGPSYAAFVLVPNWLLLLPLFGIGIAAALRQTVTEVLVVDTAPPHRRATILGGYYLLAQPLGGLAAPVLGALAALVGIAAAYGGICFALAACSGLVVLFQHPLGVTRGG